MKNKLRFLPLLFFAIFTINLNAQCPVIEGAMVNACEGDLSDGFEGNNEYFVFTTGSSVAVSSYTLNYYTSSSSSSLYSVMSGAYATTKGTGLASGGVSGTITSSCTYTEVTNSSTIIPSGSRVLFIPSNFTRSYDISGLCSDAGLYVVYIDPNGASPNWNTNSSGGNFANSPSGDRYLELLVSGTSCSEKVSYTSSAVTGSDGDFVSWTTGSAVGYNDGCSSMPSPCTASVISGLTTVDEGSTISLTAYTAGGTWSSDNTSIATVDASGVVTGVAEGAVVINYTIGTCVGTYAITVGTTCNVTVVTTDPDPVCSPSTVDLTATAVTSGSTSGLTYTYFTDASASSSLTDATAVDASGTYYIVGTDAGCSDTTAVSVTIKTTPSVTATNNSPVTVGEDVDLFASTITGATYSWTGPNSFTSITQSPIISDASMLDEGIYAVVATLDGCTSEASETSVIVNPLDVTVPEAFSPNGDNVNEYFVVENLEYYTNNKIVIFNRWGDKIYEANPYENDWDGHLAKGKDVPVGTYFYILDLGEDGKLKKGFVYLNR